MGRARRRVRATATTPASAAAWVDSNKLQALTFTANQNNVIDNTQYIYVASISDEYGGSAEPGNLYVGMDCNVTTATPSADNAIELSIGYSIVDDPQSPSFVKILGSGQIAPPPATVGGQSFFPVNLRGVAQAGAEGSLYIQPGITSDQTVIAALYGNVTMEVYVWRSTGIVGD